MLGHPSRLKKLSALYHNVHRIEKPPPAKGECKTNARTIYVAVLREGRSSVERFMHLERFG